MKKFKFKDGSIITASTVEEARAKHKVMAASIKTLNLSIDLATAKELSLVISKDPNLHKLADRVKDKLDRFILKYPGNDTTANKIETVKKLIDKYSKTPIKGLKKTNIVQGEVYMFDPDNDGFTLNYLGVNKKNGMFIGYIDNDTRAGDDIKTDNIKKFENFVKEWVAFVSLPKKERFKIRNSNKF